MWMVRVLCLGIFVVMGCSAPPTKQKDPPKEAPVMVEETKTIARPTPWQVAYHDGSGNGYFFSQASQGAPLVFRYSPVTPRMSSSGTYSGGEPVNTTLGADQIEALWTRVEALEADTASHASSRMKGTGAFDLKTPSGERGFIVGRGEALRAFGDFVAAYRKP